MYPWQRPQTSKPKQKKSTGGKCNSRTEVRNPLTGNCVITTGDLGKLVIAIGRGGDLPECKDSEEVYNPVTLKCVPRSSRAGQTISALVAIQRQYHNVPNSQASSALRVLASHLQGNKDNIASTNMLHKLSQVNRGIRASVRHTNGGEQMWREMTSQIMTHFDRRQTFKVNKDDDWIEDSLVIESDAPGKKYRLMLNFSLSRRTFAKKWYVHEVALALDEVIPDGFRSVILIRDQVQFDNYDHMIHGLSTMRYMKSPKSRTRNTYLCLALFVRAIISQVKSHGIKDAEGCLETLKNLEIKFKKYSEEMITNAEIENRNRGYMTSRPTQREPTATAQRQEVAVGQSDETAREERAWRAVLARVLEEAREITSNTTGLYGHKEAVARMKDLPSLLMAKGNNQ